MRIETPYKLWSMAGELNTAIVGSTIEEVYIPKWSLTRFDKAVKNKAEIHPKALIGWYFSSVETHGKSLILKLENFGIGTRYMGCNLGQGCWVVRPEYFHSAPWDAFIYVLYLIKHPSGQLFQLMFYDKKRHGKLEIREKIHEVQLLNRYGPAIDSPQFSLEWVYFVFRTQPKIRNGSVLKRLLLEQKYFAGLTNRMVSEILFLANIHPAMKVHDLTDEQIDKIYISVLIIFSTFAKKRGYHEYMISGRIHCPVCDTKVETNKYANLTTYFCPKCQSPDYRKPLPVSREYVENILKLTANMEYVKNGIEQWNERAAARSVSGEGFLPVDVVEGKVIE
jgi:formamidopyrimidine-DNA glycosylase